MRRDARRRGARGLAAGLGAAVLAGVLPSQSTSHPPVPPAGAGAHPVELAFDWIAARMDTYQAGSTPRLIETFESTTSGLQYRADVYASSLAIHALLARGRAGDVARARVLGDGMIYVQSIDPGANKDIWVPAPDGRLRGAYYATDLTAPPPGGPSMFERGAQAGNQAWAMLALTRLYQRTSVAAYLDAARWVAGFVEQTYRSSGGPGGYTIGYVTDWGAGSPFYSHDLGKSMEMNLDLIAAFGLLTAVDPDPAQQARWSANAAHATAYAQHPSLYDSTAGHYWVGSLPGGGVNTNPTQQALDANAYPILLGWGSQTLPWIEQSLGLSHHGFTGFDFNADRDGVWFEGTAVVALAYRRAGNLPGYRAVLAELRRVQATTPTQPPGALRAACHDGVSTGFGWSYPDAPDLAATCWFVMAELGYDPLEP